MSKLSRADRKPKAKPVEHEQEDPSFRPESGRTFSNAFNLAKRELPGVREAGNSLDRASESDTPTDEVEVTTALSARINRQIGRSSGLRRPT